MTHFSGILAHWARRKEEPLALATVVRTTGSTYRKVGARMLIGRDGETVGMLSGGCLERDIAERAGRVLRGGAPVLAAYDTRRVLGCNGAIEILIEVADGSLFHAAQECFDARKALAGATLFETSGNIAAPLGSYPLVAEGGADFGARSLPEMLRADGRLALDSERPLQRSYEFACGSAAALLQAIAPPVRLCIFGAGPDVAPLAALAARIGWSLVPEEYAASFTPDSRTVAVVMTHNYGRDLAHLAALLPMPLAYVGLLGPRSRREKILADLLDLGTTLDRAALDRLHSPAGLDIGADGPEEIALSIVAEIKAVLARRAGGFLRRAP